MAEEFVPVVEIAVTATANTDSALLHATLSRLAAEDAGFRFAAQDPEGRVILAATDERQLEQKLDALRHIAGVAFSADPPQIAFRETITRRAEVDYSHKRQRSGEFARVALALDPHGLAGHACRIETAGAALPAEYVAGVSAGIERGLRHGIVEGFPVVGITVTLVDGAWHDLDSSAAAFAIAATAALREGLQNGGPVVLEPIMKVEIATPEEYVAQVIDDLAVRRGHVLSRATRAGSCMIVATVPAANLLGYASALRPLSGGRATYALQFDHYAPLPPPDDPLFRPAVGMRP